MTIGPLEVITIEFKGNKFKGEIVPALREVVEKGVVRIIDLVFVHKDPGGKVTSLELSDLDENDGNLFDQVEGDITGLLSETDIAQASEMLENNSSALLILFEHAWASRIKEAVANANGRVVLDYRVPPEIVAAAVDAGQLS
jgi:uncharacterized membrane protein